MSLSFVSSAVQVGTADGGFEETAIESKETAEVNRRNAHKPLFEQLRSNREEAEEQEEEARRLLLRSTCALDDEDVAHLDYLRKQRTERDEAIRERTIGEVEHFRAARALRDRERKLAELVVGIGVEESDGVGGESVGGARKNGKNDDRTKGPTEAVVATAARLPAIRVKKRKRRTDLTDAKAMTTTSAGTDRASDSAPPPPKPAGKSSEPEPTPPSLPDDAGRPGGGGGGLGGLLSGYGSSSSDDDDE
eukprot:CAMPEP_0197176218 /NCGR_PEP_ID=MMETSP1423-20130617/2223_1 /TAXON_ID=476441 /ORGANISM="Pseudo-nitzschia heimii, Strain UNC1101" /LENGTH=248 /DNA_ID=CAMNT_0042625559 /DNA_START=169 /DNA_END=915 /DNA_ORIENTATION=+